MAEATAKLLGRPGVALVTRGPGAANAMPGVYIASQDRSPMVLLIGLPARGLLTPCDQAAGMAQPWAMSTNRE